MDANTLYNELLEEIAEDEASLAEKKEFIRLLKARLDRENRRPRNDQSQFPSSVVAASVIAQREGENSNASFAQAVAREVKSFGDREFAVGDVFARMQITGVALGEKPKGRITTVLTRLKDTGILVRTFEGGGNVPHKYRLTAAA